MHASTPALRAPVPSADLARYLLAGGAYGLVTSRPPVVMPVYSIGDLVRLAAPEGEPRFLFEGQTALVAEILPHDEAAHGSRRAYVVRYVPEDGHWIEEATVNEGGIAGLVQRSAQVPQLDSAPAPAVGIVEGLDTGSLDCYVEKSGSLSLLDHVGDVVARLPATFPHDRLRHVSVAYETGLKHGNAAGRSIAQHEIRRALGL